MIRRILLIGKPHFFGLETKGRRLGRQRGQGELERLLQEMEQLYLFGATLDPKDTFQWRLGTCSRVEKTP